MSPPARLFGPDRVEIVDLDSWFQHAPPAKGLAQWKDGYSAKEHAKAWLRSGAPEVPGELWAALTPFVGRDPDEFYGRPEHKTTLDQHGRARQHDLFGCVKVNGTTALVVGVEAKACETFDGFVADRATAEPPSNKRARCNLLSRALFGRDVMDQRAGAILDEDLGHHGYQLWTAAVGTIIEAQQRGVDNAVLLVQQFVPRDTEAAKRTGDTRDWATAITTNAAGFEAFAAALESAGGISHETDFVKPGTCLHAVKVETFFA